MTLKKKIGVTRMGTKTRMKKSNLEGRRSALLAKREELITRLYARRSEIVAEREFDDEVGVALQTVGRDPAYVSIENETRMLAEVELSLRRLETGEYGFCGSCGVEIPAARLEALPWTRVCVACAGGGLEQNPKSDKRDAAGDTPQNVIRFQRSQRQFKTDNG